VPEDAAVNVKVSGGAVGIAGAQEAHVGSQTFINNFYGPAPRTEIAKRDIPPCPYPGLAYFGPDDASRFFGREQAIQGLVTAVTKRSFTALVGASGSGKSSVVLAGLWPTLAQGGWRSTYFRIGSEPDKNPFAALARALSPLLGDGDVVDRMTRAQKLANSLASGDISLAYAVGQCRAANPAKRILLIADQFEEVFTLVSDQALRNRFIDALIGAFPDASPGTTPDVCLVLTLRGDFVGQAISDRALADKLRNKVELLGPMTRSELREAIVKPAEAVSVGFEAGLVDTILDDVEKRPGSLPLLQFALREMWGWLMTPQMTRADYDALDGVEGALAKRAQAIFNDATQDGSDEAKTWLFRRLFTRLVTLGEGAEDTRRIVSREELGPDAWALAQRLADEDNRLVVTAAATPGQETAEVVHEALIRNWPALVEWVTIDREFQTWLRGLKPRLDEWHANPSDPGTLMRGGPLVLAEKWMAQRGDELNSDEKAFVVASVELRKAELQQEKEDREHKLAGLTALARERAASVFVELRGQLLIIWTVSWFAMLAGQLFSTFLFTLLFRSEYNLLNFIFALYSSVIFASAGLQPTLGHYMNTRLLVDPRRAIYDISTSGSPLLSLPRSLSSKWLFLKYLPSFSKYLPVGIHSFILSFMLLGLWYFTVEQLVGIDASIEPNPKSVFLEMLFVPLIYAIGLTVLMDIQIAGGQNNPIFGGAIIGIMVGIGQVLRIEYLGAPFGIFFAAFAFINLSSGFAVGWYFPVTAAATLMRAKNILDQCCVETLTSELQDISRHAPA
jgi:energy-coupling factor transporter ATP-binding protein EcfA2